MTHNNNRSAFCRYAITLVQLLSLILSISPIQLPPGLAVMLYCLVVFPTPFLLLAYYCAYLNRAEKWLWNGIPFVSETVFSILYIGAMIYGIRFEANSTLFSQLLSAYLACALLCTLGYLTHYVESN